MRRLISVLAAGTIIALVLSNLAAIVSDTFREYAHDALVGIGVIGALSAIPMVARAVQERGAAKRALANLQREVQARKVRSAQVYKRIATRTARSAAMNAGSVVAEAVPVAGVAVMLAVTAADLVFACQTMQDLRELDEQAATPEEQQTVCGFKVPSLQ